jgi:SAM-dependent methyltransferase
MYPEQDAGKPGLTPKAMNASFTRTESLSSNSGATSLSTRTMISTDPSASGEKEPIPQPFVQRNGRTYLNDPTLPYPLPSDLTELHRQCLRTLLLIQVFGAPVCSPSLIAKPPMRVLEIGCGSGFWSMMCHRFFKSRGHSGISFTGIDIAPLAPGSANIASDSTKPDRDMKWKFVHHDLRSLPWPLPYEEYDLVMVKDMSLVTTNLQQEAFVEEYIRLLRPGGTLEIWESDHTIRMLRPHVPGSGTSDDSEEQETASRLGSYVMNANTPLSAPLNTFLVEYNHWLSRALEARSLSAVPCTLIGPMLLQEADCLTDVRSRRLAIPLSEVRWEREGVGGVVTKDGKSYVEMKGKGAPHQKVEKKSLSSAQAALRKTALLTVVQQVQALEPILREISGKSIDEWDLWLGKMMGDLMSESGTSWGECLEVGAWWAKKQA